MMLQKKNNQYSSFTTFFLHSSTQRDSARFASRCDVFHYRNNSTCELKPVNCRTVWTSLVRMAVGSFVDGRACDVSLSFVTNQLSCKQNQQLPGTTQNGTSFRTRSSDKLQASGKGKLFFKLKNCQCNLHPKKKKRKKKPWFCSHLMMSPHLLLHRTPSSARSETLGVRLRCGSTNGVSWR